MISNRGNFTLGKFTLGKLTLNIFILGSNEEHIPVRGL